MRLILPTVYLLAISLISARAEAPDMSPAESTAFEAITEAMMKTRQGGDNPTEMDLQARRKTGWETVNKAKEFLKNYPGSPATADVDDFISVSLFQTALAGDSNAVRELEARATDYINNTNRSQTDKLALYSMNRVAQSMQKSGKSHLDGNSSEFQTAHIEAIFAAADVLPDKEFIFRTLLLQAQSSDQLSREQKQAIAKRALNHSNAPPAIQVKARKILSGEREYTVGKPLQLSFTALDGRKVDLSELKGKVVLIEFWATWCGPCIAGVPALKSVYEKYHSKGFEIIGISLDDKKEDLLRFLKKHEMAWPQYFDGKHWNNDVSFRFGIDSVPTQWLIDKNGILRDTLSRSDLDKAVRGLLEERVDPSLE